MRFVVIGAGAIGGVVGGRLIAAGYDVALVARGAHAEAITTGGLHVHCPTGTEVVRAVVHPTVAAAAVTSDDVVFVAVKSQDTVAVLDELAVSADPDVPIVCFQNGIVNEREALRRFANVYGVVVMCPTVYLEPGHVLAHSAPTTGILDVGRFPAGVDAVAEAVASALASSRFSSVAVDDIERWKWAKLVTNLGNAIEAVCGPEARRGPLGDIVRAEGYAVLDAAGIDYASADEDTQRRGNHLQLQRVDGQRRPGGSTWQSLQRGATSVETDYLNGEIVMLGRVHGVATPANERLQRLARELAAGRRGPGTVDAHDVITWLERG